MAVAVILTDYEKALKIIKQDSRKERLYELRLDCDEKLLSLVNKKIIPSSKIILTVRSMEEGGQISDQFERKKIINKAMEMQVGYLDLELKSDLDIIKEMINKPKLMNSQKLIISQHNYSPGTRNHYNEFYRKWKNIVGDRSIESELLDRVVLKHVSTPNDAHEMYELLSSKPKPESQILLGMGTNGEISRTLHSELNQEFVFGSVDDPNILSYSLLEGLTDSKRLMLGLIGQNLNHSLSAKIHQIFLHYTKKIGYYHLLEANTARQANELISGLFERNFNGLNITFPYKNTIIDILDSMSSEATKINTVNTVKKVDGKLKGFNTDITGFSAFLRNHNLHKLDSAVILGAGGASRAVSQALIQENIDVQVITRGIGRHAQFTNIFGSEISIKQKSDIVKTLKADMYINATPLGLKGEDPQKFLNLPNNTKVVIDLLYEANDTKFIRAVKKQGIEAYDGKEMLFNQALDAFEIWTDTKLDREPTFNRFISEVQVN